MGASVQMSTAVIIANSRLIRYSSFQINYLHVRQIAVVEFVGKEEKILACLTISKALTTCSTKLPTPLSSIAFAQKVPQGCLVRSRFQFAQVIRMFVSTGVSVFRLAMNGSVIATAAKCWLPGRFVNTSALALALQIQALSLSV